MASLPARFAHYAPKRAIVHGRRIAPEI